MTSIEFRPICSFTSPLFSTQKSTRRAVRDGVVTASVTLFVPQRGCLFVGLTDGKILCWEADRSISDKRSSDGRTRILEGHKGAVRCMIFVESLCKGVMFTGAADRSIRMWDLSDPRTAIPCVHSLYGHGGTVLAVEYGADLLLSSSTDGFMCLWRDQSPAKLLRFPAYTIRQKIAPDPKVAAQGARIPKDLWFLSLAIREGEALSIFAGDSEGYVHIYKPDFVQVEGGDHADQLFLLLWKTKIHDLGISRIMTVPMESFLFTLSFDQKFKTLDSLSGQVIFEESNQCNAVFNGLAWDSVCQDVIVVDDKGNIGFYNLYMESCVVWRNLTKDQIIQVHYEPSTRRLLLLSPHVLRIFDVVRGVKFSELNEHTGPVVAMASRPTPQGGLLYTAAMDNTIRLWDTDGLECIKSLKEKKHEITAMVYLPRANVIITGHENSDLKMWSLDCQQDALLRTVSGQPVHENTISSMVWAAGGVDDAAALKSTTESFSTGSVGKMDVGTETLVAGSYDRQLSFWKITLTSDGTAMARFERAFLAHEEVHDEVLAVAYSSAANSVFTGGNEGVIRKWAFWGVGQLEAAYEGHEDAIICFAVDGNFLFSGSADCTVRVWETSQGYELKVVRVHEVTVQSLLVIPETGFVASCAFDGRVVFWDPQVGRPHVNELQTYEQPEQFRSLAYVDLNRSILVGCESGKIIAFPLPNETASAAASVLPKVLGGIETPPSSRAGDSDGHRTLETLRRSPA
mmetsp:Transcript_80063/g.226597  ORF Transcript_80063/g.226597 Transcript_80063/m.226597 type:complete len:742 (+) Transcript_80063:88-2313(+)